MPATPWNVNWSPTTCTLVRGFGDISNPDVLWIERFGPSEGFDLSFISDKLGETQFGSPVWITFGTQKPVKLIDALSGKTEKGVRSTFIGTMTLAARDEHDADRNPKPEQQDAALEASVTTLTVQAGSHEVLFQTGPLNKPFAALRQCTADLVKSWGLDPDEQAALASLPGATGNPWNWITPGDYPSSMLSAGKQAIVHFRLMVDERGRPTDCAIQRSVSDKKFDEVTCAKLMARARFRPALDRTGKPVASYYLNSVRWVIPP